MFRQAVRLGVAGENDEDQEVVPEATGRIERSNGRSLSFAQYSRSSRRRGGGPSLFFNSLLLTPGGPGFWHAAHRLITEHSAVVWETRIGARSSNPLRSTFQSPRFRTSQRIARNPRVCARFAIVRGPRERLFLRDSSKLANSSLGAIYLGPRIIASDSLPRSSPSIRLKNGCFGAGVPKTVRASRTLFK